MDRYKYFGLNDEGYPDVFSPSNDIFDQLDESNHAVYYVTKNDLARFSTFIASYYGTSDYDWLVLWFNGYKNIADLYIGAELKIPSMEVLSYYQSLSWSR